MSESPKIIFHPRIVTHSVKPHSGVLEDKTKGGLPRTRADVLGGYSVVPVSWVCDTDAKFNYLMAMYETNLVEGTLPFQLFIPVLSSTCKWVECKFVRGSFKHPTSDGVLRTVTATVRVMDKRDTEFDVFWTDLITATESLDEADHLALLNLFNNLVNVEIPDNLGTGGGN